jgi:hypothetical protein
MRRNRVMTIVLFTMGCAGIGAAVVLAPIGAYLLVQFLL